MFQYSCGRCGKPVEKSARVCPHCGAKLGNIHCKHCGYTGTQSDFVDDHCPRCNAVVRTTPVRYERCKECGKKLEAGQWTCAHCGHTQWGVILGLGTLSVACIAAAVVLLPLPTVWTLLVGGVGVALFYSAFYGIGGALRWRGLTTFLTTSLMLAMLCGTSLAARYRYFPETSIIQAPEAVVAAAALTETPVPSTTPRPTSTPQATATPEITGVITAQLANIRQGPSTDTSIVGTVAKDESIVLLGRSADSGWVKMQSQKGDSGWVWAPLVETQGTAIKDLPEVK